KMRKRTERALQKAKETAEEARAAAESANRAKSAFLANMSHELRTPLNAVLGFAQLLELDDQLNAQQKDSVSEIQRAGNHLLELINEVLDLAKIESGRMDLSLEPVLLSRIIEECCTLTESIAANRGIHLHRHVCDNNISDDETADEYVYADNVRLKQILLNLLSNAVKYNRTNGSVTVQCREIPENRLRIMIKDTGYGMSEEKQAQLFQPFNRLGAESGNIEGTGIGLVITKRLVQLMSGKIGVESTPGYGSTFWVELPQVRFEQTNTLSPVNQSAESPNLPQRKTLPIQTTNGRVLVVEDNRTNQTILAHQLMVLGYSADVVCDAKQGFAKWKTNHYKAILTDINMPDINGLEFTKLIRKAEQDTGGHTPIIAITAKALKGDEEQCLLAGMDDYLAKPIDINKLKQILSNWLSDFNTATTTTNENPSTAIEKKQPAVDINVLRNIVGDNHTIHMEILQSFVDNSVQMIQDIHTAYANHSAADMIWSSHKLKSSSLAIGATTLSASCEALEVAAKQNHWQDITLIYSELDDLFSDVMKHIQYYEPAASNDVEQDTKTFTPNPGFAFVSLLAIDDDSVVLSELIEVVKQLGIKTPASASGGKQALRILDSLESEKSDSSINLILCDLNMPGMDGIEFLRHLAQRYYSGGIILISGEDNRVLKAAEKLANAHHLQVLGTLQKPVTASQLQALIVKLAVENQSELAVEQMVSSQELAQGIEQGQLTVYYQPVIEIASANIVAMEALARWQHPQKGILGPDTFVSVAENSQLIDALTVEVFSQAVQQAKSWNDAGQQFRVTINLSMDSLKRLELPEIFISRITQSGLDYKKIGFEVTESRLMHDIATSLEILTRLKLKGIELSIDDFGTGYSTLEQLQRIPFGELKVDRQFVSGAVHDSANRAILESSVLLAKKLGMKVVAEGVETEAELEVVTRLGCDYLQGYYVSEPMPGSEVLSWVYDWKRSNQFLSIINKTGT
ncbi:EAL domain-containing protein, partial [Kaarinaea lacus]